MLNELDERQFKATIVQPVRQVAEENKPKVDLNSYLKECGEKLKLLKKRSDFVPMQTYASGDDRHVHLILWYGVPNRALVLVIDRPQELIIGHHLLTVDDEGGTSGFPWPIKTPKFPVISATNEHALE
jgi:hypothetical protein